MVSTGVLYTGMSKSHPIRQKVWSHTARYLWRELIRVALGTRIAMEQGNEVMSSDYGKEDGADGKFIPPSI